MARQKKRTPRATSSLIRAAAKQQVGRAPTKSRIVIATAVVGLCAIITLSFAYCSSTTIPRVFPSNADATGLESLPFLIENRSNLFSMRDVTLKCRLDRGVFATEDGSKLITPPNSSHKPPPIIAEYKVVAIAPGAHISFACNETRAISNPRFSEQFKKFQSAQVHLEIAWSIFGWKKEYFSPKFRRSEVTGFAWTEDETPAF